LAPLPNPPLTSAPVHSGGPDGGAHICEMQRHTGQPPLAPTHRAVAWRSPSRARRARRGLIVPPSLAAIMALTTDTVCLIVPPTLAAVCTVCRVVTAAAQRLCEGRLRQVYDTAAVTVRQGRGAAARAQPPRRPVLTVPSCAVAIEGAAGSSIASLAILTGTASTHKNSCHTETRESKCNNEGHRCGGGPGSIPSP
jgi:hypothetical protein